MPRCKRGAATRRARGSDRIFRRVGLVSVSIRRSSDFQALDGAFDVVAGAAATLFNEPSVSLSCRSVWAGRGRVQPPRDIYAHRGAPFAFSVG
jgi:hypothetical protein